MHEYIILYLDKKMLEWTANPEEAFSTALYLNTSTNWMIEMPTALPVLPGASVTFFT
jgi:hypothetical protein